jgi:hypothetical protein
MQKEELYTQSQVDTIEYLAKGFAKAEERERIITLLTRLSHPDENSVFWIYEPIDYVIERIKGEK